MTRDELNQMLEEWKEAAESGDCCRHKDNRILSFITMLREALQCLEQKDRALEFYSNDENGFRVTDDYYDKHGSICIPAREALALKPSFLMEEK